MIIYSKEKSNVDDNLGEKDSNEVDKLLKQLENQQLTSLILKNQLKYNLTMRATNTPNSTPTSDLLRSFSSSPNGTSTTTTMSHHHHHQNTNLIQSLINLNNSTNNKFFHRSDSFSLNLSPSPLLLTTTPSSKSDNSIDVHFNNYDDVDNEIIEHTSNVGDVINQVAAASEEQSATAEEISRSIEAITTVSQESASGVQQIANASEDLSRLTVNLQEQISKFKIANMSAEQSENESEYWMHEN